jgi:glycosyltransferase involved in cell wall biosynthesis
MACRKPVVSTTVGGIPEIVENGKNGILVEPDDPRALADALSVVLRDHDLRESLASNGFSKVHEQFSVDNTGTAYAELFAEISRS